MELKPGFNKHGLSRTIPPDVKRQVRQRCGFGCIKCGCGIIQYEHVDPEFHEASVHDPASIVTLCPTCHANVTSKFWSKATIKKYAENPACLQTGVLKHEFDFFSDSYPSIRIGGVTHTNCSTPIEVFDRPVISIKPPETKGGPFRISGTFCDRFGAPTLKIVDNEWIAYSDSWDVEVSAGKIIIRNGPGDIVLKMVVDPPNSLSVERLKMRMGFVDIEATAEKLVINGNSFVGLLFDGCDVGLSIYSLRRPAFNEHWSPLARFIRAQACA
ncbi:hypothetical protein [Pseudomonas solani]|uniref:hypothetical protein n=1 Tax=Pseudomonas solani TaxID=2731552 RepID=UPI0022368B49|nr:hypothetical protein [Pseudomonas solani]